MRKFGIIVATVDHGRMTINYLQKSTVRAAAVVYHCGTGFHPQTAVASSPPIISIPIDSASSTMPIENLYIARVIDGLILVCLIRVL